MDEEDVLPPTTTMAATTVTIWGDRRKALDTLTKREWAFLGVSVVGILLTIALTIYRLVVVVRFDPAHPDFTIAILILASAVFCLWYAIHGLLYERKYELYLLVAAISLVVLYCIIDYGFNVQGRTRVKLVRLVLACVMALVNIPLAILVANTFRWLMFVTVGASQLYQSMYMELARFLHLQKFDVQVAVSIVILRMRDGTSLDTIEIITLVLGVTVSVVWYVIGSYSVQRERKWLTFVFALMCLLEPAYITYRLVVVFKNLPFKKEMVVLRCLTLAAGFLGLLVRAVLVIQLWRVFKNFGKGLAERAYNAGENAVTTLTGGGTAPAQDVPPQDVSGANVI